MSCAEFDIAVIGGGIAGLAFACALKDEGRRIIVAERGYFSTGARVSYDLRVNSIHLGSEAFLRKIGAWNKGEFRCCPFQSIEVWGESGGRIHFRADEIDKPHLGHIVENSVLTGALAAVAESAESIELRESAELQSIRPAGDSVELSFMSGDTVHAGVVVGADGGNSLVRSFAGIEARERSYGQTAIVAQIETGVPHLNTSFQRFLRGGPLAFLPLGDGTCSIVWSLESRQAADLMDLSDEQFGDTLARCLDYRLGETRLVSKKVSFDLRRICANAYLSQRALLIGDSAHVIHPLAGMGANLGLMDAAALAQIIAGRLAGSQDVWNHQAYREYERWRKAVNTPVMHAMDGFDAGFRSFQPVLPAVLGIGMSAVNSMPALKRPIMQLACGISGDLPEAARYGAESSA